MHLERENIGNSILADACAEVLLNSNLPRNLCTVRLPNGQSSKGFAFQNPDGEVLIVTEDFLLSPQVGKKEMVNSSGDCQFRKTRAIYLIARTYLKIFNPTCDVNYYSA